MTHRVGNQRWRSALATLFQRITDGNITHDV
jgi:hypothetical protein